MSGVDSKQWETQARLGQTPSLLQTTEFVYPITSSLCYYSWPTHLHCIPAPLPVLWVVGSSPHVKVGLHCLRTQNVHRVSWGGDCASRVKDNHLWPNVGICMTQNHWRLLSYPKRLLKITELSKEITELVIKVSLNTHWSRGSTLSSLNNKKRSQQGRNSVGCYHCQPALGTHSWVFHCTVVSSLYHYILLYYLIIILLEYYQVMCFVWLF